jgi:hypothetical protein
MTIRPVSIVRNHRLAHFLPFPKPFNWTYGGEQI